MSTRRLPMQILAAHLRRGASARQGRPHRRNERGRRKHQRVHPGLRGQGKMRRKLDQGLARTATRRVHLPVAGHEQRRLPLVTAAVRRLAEPIRHAAQHHVHKLIQFQLRHDSILDRPTPPGAQPAPGPLSDHTLLRSLRLVRSLRLRSESLRVHVDLGIPLDPSPNL